MRSSTTSETPARESDRSPLEVLSAAWAGEVLLCLHDGPRHFNALRRALDDLPASTLSARLAELEAAELVVRSECGDRPARVVYALAARGETVAATLRKLDELGDRE